MEKIKKLKFNVSKTIIIALIILLSTITITVSADETSSVSIDPSNQTVSSGETFSIDVTCAPGQPIKSFEFQLLFNPSLLQVNSVIEGDIFDGYTTHFNAGTINNVTGTVIDIYGLIVGDGNVTDSGTFVTISCTAKDVSGISALDLSGVGVTNETAYVTISVTDGTVQIDATAPQFDDNSPSTGTTGDSYTFNVSVTDSVDSAEDITVKVDWSHGSQGSNQTMTHVGGNYFEKTVTLDSSSISDMTYIFYANDTNGNSAITSSTSVTVTDNDDPSLVGDNSDGSGTTGDSFDFDVSVSDNVDVGGVNVSWVHGSLSGNLALSDDGDDTWSGSVTLDDNVDSLVYRVQVNDSSGNYVRGSQQSKSVSDNDNPQMSDVTATPGSQDVGGTVNITVVITDNIAIDDVYLNIIYPDSSTINMSIAENKTDNTYYCNRTYNDLGSYSYSIWVSDTNYNSITSSTYSFSIGEDTPPVISNIALTNSSPLDTDSSFGWVNITCDVIDNVEVSLVYLNILNPNGTWNNVTMTTGASSTYYYNSSTAFSTYGNYSYSIWANDTSNNIEHSISNDFSMSPNWDINSDGDCNVYDLVSVSNYYNQTGSPGWIRQDVDNNGQIQVIDLVLISGHYDESW